MPEDEDNDADSREGDEGPSDFDCPRFTFALLFWNHICTRLDDMPSWSASCTRVCWEGILSVWKICSRMAS